MSNDFQLAIEGGNETNVEPNRPMGSVLLLDMMIGQTVHAMEAGYPPSQAMKRLGSNIVRATKRTEGTTYDEVAVFDGSV